MGSVFSLGCIYNGTKLGVEKWTDIEQIYTNKTIKWKKVFFQMQENPMKLISLHRMISLHRTVSDKHAFNRFVDDLSNFEQKSGEEDKVDVIFILVTFYATVIIPWILHANLHVR